MRNADAILRTFEVVSSLQRQMRDLQALRRTLALIHAERGQSKGDRRRIRRRTPRQSDLPAQNLLPAGRSKPPL
jgi:hypothetical protein